MSRILNRTGETVRTESWFDNPPDPDDADYQQAHAVQDALFEAEEPPPDVRPFGGRDIAGDGYVDRRPDSWQ